MGERLTLGTKVSLSVPTVLNVRFEGEDRRSAAKRGTMPPAVSATSGRLCP